MRVILALGRFRMDLEMALLSRAAAGQDSTDEDVEVHELESDTEVAHPIGFLPNDDDED